MSASAVIVAAVVTQLVVSMTRTAETGGDVATVVANFFSFFTILSNVLTVVALAWALKEMCYAAWSSEPQRAAIQTVHEAEKAAILRALELFPDDRRAAAESLGLSRSAFYRRLTLYGIRPPR